MKETLKNKLKNQYESLSEQPSENLWNRIEEQLGQKKSPVEKSALPVYKRSEFLKAAAVFLLFASLGIFLKVNRNSEQQQTAATAKTPEMVAKPEVAYVNEMNPTNGNQQENKIKATKSLVVPGKREANHFPSKSGIAEKALPEMIHPAVSARNLDSTTNEQLAQRPFKSEPTKYITAQDLLFEREAVRTLKEQQRSQTSKLGSITGMKIEKPKEVRILGITVYSADEEP